MIFSTKQLHLVILCTFLGFGEMGFGEMGLKPIVRDGLFRTFEWTSAHRNAACL